MPAPTTSNEEGIGGDGIGGAMRLCKPRQEPQRCAADLALTLHGHGPGDICCNLSSHRSMNSRNTTFSLFDSRYTRPIYSERPTPTQPESEADNPGGSATAHTHNAVTHDHSPPRRHPGIDGGSLHMEFQGLGDLLDMVKSKRDELLLAIQLEESPSAQLQTALAGANLLCDQIQPRWDELRKTLGHVHAQTSNLPPVVQHLLPPAQNTGDMSVSQAPVLVSIKKLFLDGRVKSHTASSLSRCKTLQQALCLILMARGGAPLAHEPWYKVRHTFWCPLLKQLSFAELRHGQILACMLVINCYQPANERCADEFFALLATMLPTEIEGWPDELGPYRSICIQGANHYIALVRDGCTRTGNKTKHTPSASILQSLGTIDMRLKAYSQQAIPHAQIDMRTLESTPWPADL